MTRAAAERPQSTDLSVSNAEQTEVGRIVTVQVGPPRTVTWQGNEVRTGIFKDPVEGPVHLARTNLDGDGQADLVNHGGENKAVYAYPIEHYSFWRDQLGTLPPGTALFGENLTVEGLDERQVCIGDILRVGTAMVQISQPRYPCFKLELRHDRPGLADHFVHADRPGIYFRVLQPGTVRAGDGLYLVSRDPGRLSVADHLRLFALTGAGDVPALRAASANTAVMPSWREIFKKRADAFDAGRHAPGWPGLRRFTVTRRDTETADVVVLTLAPTDGGPLPHYRPGQFVAVELFGEQRPRPVVRCYSLCDAPGRDHLRIAIRRLEPTADGSGGVSAYLYDNVTVGSRLALRAPAGAFHARADQRRRLVLIAGGLGITPVHGIASAVAAGQIRRTTDVFYVARRPGQDPFADSLTSLAESADELSVRIYYSRHDDAAGEPGSARVVNRRLRALDIIEVIGDDEADFLLCGPAPMCRELIDALRAHGVPESNIGVETFGPDAARAMAAPIHCPPDGFTVSFTASRQTSVWNDPSVSLLDLAEQRGVTIANSCRSGSCGTCAVTVRRGTVAYLRPPAALLDEDQCLTCVAAPAADIELDI